MKKIISVLLTIILISSVVPTKLFDMTASAATTHTSDCYTYTVSSGKATITGVDGSISANLTIPSTLGGYAVSYIGDEAFKWCEGLISVTIPEGVIGIGDYAFYNCIDLTKISIPNTVNSIGESAFNCCYSLVKINIPNKLETIAKDCFKNCYSLTSLIIPNSVTSIGESAFSGCEGLINIIIPDSVTSIGKATFYYCSSLTSITIPNSVTSIADDTFYRCNSLKKITIPNSVTRLGASAFWACENLENVIIGDGVTAIEEDTFADCYSIKSVTIGKKVTKIAGYAFNDCTSIEKIVIPNSVTEIGNSAFNDCEALTSATIGTGVKSIGDNAFGGCGNLKKITIPDSVETIGESAFSYCEKMESAIIGNKVSIINKGSFSDCESLKSVKIGNNVTIIDESAFNGCENLKNITMPDSIEVIAAYAFSNCENIENVWYTGSKADKENIVIASDNEYLKTAKWYYNICKTSHSYSNACDKSCNNCDYLRSVPAHKYSNNCDTTCNVCKATRKITHTYKTVVDTKATLTKNGKTVKKCSVCGWVATGSAVTIRRPKTFKLSATSYTYNGKVKTPTVTVKDSAGKTLKKNTDYTVTYPSGRKNVGTYKVKVTFKGKYSGTKYLSFKINPVNVSKCKVSLSATSYTYNGAVKTPTVTVKNASGTKLTKNTHYTVTHASGRKNVGKYKVTVKMKGNYTGTKTLYFTINPVKTAVSKLTAGKKSIKVTVGKKTAQVSGYQIQYATNKSFKSAKTKNITSYKTISTTLTKLTSKKTYYVRVRTYKTVSGKKYYSGWSSYKYKKTK